jgi:hypothetical protein
LLYRSYHNIINRSFCLAFAIHFLMCKWAQIDRRHRELSLMCFSCINSLIVALVFSFRPFNMEGCIAETHTRFVMDSQAINAAVIANMTALLLVIHSGPTLSPESTEEASEN